MRAGLSREVVALLAGFLAIGLGGCAGPSTADAGRPCPPDTAAGVIWTSQQSETRVYLVSDRAQLGEVSIPVRDLLGDSLQWMNGLAHGVSNGDVRHDQAHQVQFDPARCVATVSGLPEQMVLNTTVGDGYVYTTNTLNGIGEVHKHEVGGAEIAQAKFQDEVINDIVFDADSLYLLSIDLGAKTEPDESRTTRLRALDATTLAERWQMTLPIHQTGAHAVIHHRDLYIVEPFPTEVSEEGDRMVSVNLDTKVMREVNLGEKSPYLLRLVGDQLYVGHTFINPSKRPMNEYRAISRVDLLTGRIEHFNVDIGITQIEIGQGRLWVFGGHADDSSWLNTYSLDGLHKLSQLRLDPPKTRGHIYPAGFFLMPGS